MLTEINELEDMINHLKRELIGIAEATGLNSHHTLCCSQKLDELITTYQKLSYKKQKNRNILLNDNKAV
jgi:Spo0E like sporulation regulatory protein